MKKITNPPAQDPLDPESAPSRQVKSSKTKNWPAWVALMTLILVAIPSVMMVFPMKSSPATTSPDLFSSERAMQHLPVIASQPHPSGSPAQAEVTAYLMKALEAYGLKPEIQKTSGAENVTARLYGSNASGAIVLLAHYDSVPGSPGAGDNGSGVSVLLEVARALAASPPLNNDVILLFDDSEELPGAFTGSTAFVREHRWMTDVKVAISLDTAVGGVISTNETGPGNSWLIDALDEAYSGGAWTSFSGGGGYDTTPFREAGFMVLALEDNYPFKEKHTAMDLPEIVSESSVNQMGEQTLAITRALGNQVLSQKSTTHKTFFALPLFGFFHYPQSWAPVLAVLSSLLWLSAVILTRKKSLITLKGLLLALFFILLSTVLAALFITAVRPVLPQFFNWEVTQWPDWPEVIPPGSLYAFLFFAAMTVAFTLAAYKLARRRCVPTEFALAAFFPFLPVSLVSSFAAPLGGYLFTWPVLIGSTVWLLAAMVPKLRNWPLELPSLLGALPMVLFLLPFIPGIVMADGTKSLPILGAVLALIVSAALPSLDRIVIK